MVRLAEALGEEWSELNAALAADRCLRGRLFGVLGSSLALGDHLVANPQAWHLLQGNVRLPSPEELRAAFAECVAEPPSAAGSVVWRLRELYRNRLLVLAAMDLAPTVENEPVLSFRSVGAHLADLADAALGAALSVAEAGVCGDETPPRLAIIAMGKCGARELNYVSDVDVIFVAEPAGPMSARIAGELMRLASDAFFQVDAGLRPEGRHGELVRTLDSHVAYYQQWAKTWEFQALLKARPAAGDAELGKQYIDTLMPMVWNACERADFVPEVQAMRRRVEQLVPAEVRNRELKLGTGGLRDVEFAVQLLQLVHGRNDESLHVASTVDALAALGAGGYVGRDDTANLTASYEFLRLLEHRLQLQRLKRTHMLPASDDDEAMRWLARAAHVRPDGSRDRLGVLRDELKRHHLRVSRLHTKLFYQPLLESLAPEGLEFSEGMTPAAAERQLAALGYEAPHSALTHLSALINQSGRRGRVQSVLLPRLLDWLSDTPDPDTGLLAYRRLSEVMVSQRWYLSTLRDKPAVAKRLMHVLGTSSLRAGAADACTGGGAELQRRAGGAEAARRRPRGGGGCVGGIGGPAERPGSCHCHCAFAAPPRIGPRRIGRSAGHARRHRRMRGADRGLGGGAAGRAGRGDPGQPSRQRSSSGGDRGDRDGPARWPRAGLRVGRRRAVRLRAGRRRSGFGRGEVGGDGRRADPCAAGHAQCGPAAGGRRQSAARGPQRTAGPHARLVCRVLRRSGRSRGRSRRCCGLTRSPVTRSWVERFLHMVDKTRYPAGGVSADAVLEIRRMKARIDSERLPRGADPKTHTKLGRGGLADIEWTVQLLQLRYASEIEALHNTSTLESLDAAAEAGLITTEDADLLREAWLTATRARNALVLVRGKPTDQLPGPGRQLNTVAVAAGWARNGDGGEFLDNYLRVTRRAKAVVHKIFDE